MNTFTAAVIEDDIERAVALALDEPIGCDPFKPTEDDARKHAQTMAQYFARRYKHHDEAAT